MLRGGCQRLNVDVVHMQCLNLGKKLVSLAAPRGRDRGEGGSERLAATKLQKVEVRSFSPRRENDKGGWKGWDGGGEVVKL